MSSDYAGYKRALLRWFEREGYELNAHGQVEEYPGRSGQSVFSTREARLEAWLRESLLFAINEIERGDTLHAFNGLLQAVEYASQVGHDSSTADCTTTLKADIQDALRRGSGAVEAARQVVHDVMQERVEPLVSLVEAATEIHQVTVEAHVFDPGVTARFRLALARAQRFIVGRR